MPATVVVTASVGTFPGLVEALRALPLTVEECALMSFAPPLDWRPVDAAVEELDRFEAVAFTSPRSARAFAERLGVHGRGTGGRAVAWVAGPGTHAALGQALGEARRPADAAVGQRGAADALAEAMVAAGVAGPVLFPCGDIRRDELPARLRHDGIEVEEVVCYRSVLAGEGDARRAAARAQILVVASPSVAQLLARACPDGTRPALLAVGPTTAAAARSSGWPPAGVAARPTIEALMSAVRTLLTNR